MEGGSEKGSGSAYLWFQLLEGGTKEGAGCQQQWDVSGLCRLREGTVQEPIENTMHLLGSLKAEQGGALVVYTHIAFRPCHLQNIQMS